MTAVAPDLDLDVDLDAAVPCRMDEVQTVCPNPAVWRVALYHPDGSRCARGTGITSCDPCRADAISKASSTSFYTVTCNAHRIVDCTLEWHPL